jgi:hypothetical protein
MLAVVAMFKGSAMPVAQITMQSQAPPAMLGAASASVQLSHSVGSAIGVTVAVGMLLVTVGQYHGVADAFADAVRLGPTVLADLPEAQRTAAVARIADGLTATFLTIAIFAIFAYATRPSSGRILTALCYRKISVGASRETAEPHASSSPVRALQALARPQASDRASIASSRVAVSPLRGL